MEYEVVVGAAARADVLDIARWIAADSPGEAMGWLTRFWEAARSLRCFPARCPLAPESEVAVETIRQRIFGDYRILFTITPDSVLVLHVRHAARRPRGGKT